MRYLTSARLGNFMIQGISRIAVAVGATAREQPGSAAAAGAAAASPFAAAALSIQPLLKPLEDVGSWLAEPLPEFEIYSPPVVHRYREASCSDPPPISLPFATVPFWWHRYVKSLL